MLLGGGVFSSVEASSVPSPILHYTFENVSNLGQDSSGQGHHSENDGAVSAEGIIGKAAYFDGNAVLR
ncbi:MAG: hypothetical protein Q4B28_03455 [bacterium]|nr:hypothetical protein [bacterium]